MSSGERNRLLHYAILASLALHALLLFGLPDLISTARHAASLPPKLIARLMAPEPVPVPAPPPLPPAQAAPPEPPKKKPPPPVLAKPAPERPVQVEPPRAAAKPEPPEPPAAPAPPAPVAQPAPPAMPADPVASTPGPAAPPAASGQAIEEQSADRYRMELIAALKSMIKESYPPEARDNNWEGDVRLGMELRADGRLSVTVKRSSRFGVLDQGAIAVMRKAAEQVPVPPALRGKEATLRDLVVEYRLTD